MCQTPEVILKMENEVIMYRVGKLCLATSNQRPLQIIYLLLEVCFFFTCKGHVILHTQTTKLSLIKRANGRSFHIIPL